MSEKRFRFMIDGEILEGMYIVNALENPKIMDVVYALENPKIMNIVEVPVNITLKLNGNITPYGHKMFDILKESNK